MRTPNLANHILAMEVGGRAAVVGTAVMIPSVFPSFSLSLFRRFLHEVILSQYILSGAADTGFTRRAPGGICIIITRVMGPRGSVTPIGV